MAYGKQYDRYKTTFTFSSEDPQAIEEFICNDSVDPVEVTTPTANGFFPFGLGFATGQDYGVNILSAETKNEVYLGEIKEYQFTVVPYLSDIYNTLIASTTLAGDVNEHWSIGGVYFPCIKTNSTLNDMRYTTILNGGSAQIVDTTKPYGDIAEITVDVSEEQARLIMQFFTTVMRGLEKVAVYPLGYNIFGRRYDTLTTCKVKLFESEITQKQSGAGSVEISFKLQMVGV